MTPRAPRAATSGETGSEAHHHRFLDQILSNWGDAVVDPQAPNVEKAPLSPPTPAPSAATSPSGTANTANTTSTAGTATAASLASSRDNPRGLGLAITQGRRGERVAANSVRSSASGDGYLAYPSPSSDIFVFEQDGPTGEYGPFYGSGPSSPSTSDSSEVDHRGLAWCYGVQYEATFLLPRPTHEEYDFLGPDLISEIPLPFPTHEEDVFLGGVSEGSSGGDSIEPLYLGAPHSVLPRNHYGRDNLAPTAYGSTLEPEGCYPAIADSQGPHQLLQFRKFCVEQVIHNSKWFVRLAALSLTMSVILCTAGYDHTIRFWEALSGICSRTIQHSDSQVNRLCISPDKRFLAAAGRIDVKLYDIKSTNPNPVLTFEGHKGNVTGVGFHCEGKWMVTSSEDGTVKIWDTRTGSEQRNYDHGKDNGVNDVVIHPNQGELISCDQGGNVRIWDLGENKCTHQLIPEDEVPVRSVSVASDGSMLIAGNNRGNIFVWRMIQNRDVTSLVPITKFQAHHKYITRVLLSPDVRHLATCSADHTAKIWAVDPTAMTAMTNAAAAGPPTTTTTAVTDLAGNNTIVHTTNPSAMPGQPNAFPLEATLHQHQRWVWDCAFSADSAYLVTACSDHYARLWELSSQQIIRQYNGHHRGAVCVALNDYSER